MAIPTLDELATMPVTCIHDLLVDLVAKEAARLEELYNLRGWRTERDAMLQQYARLQLQFDAVCGELDRMHERWGDGKE